LRAIIIFIALAVTMSATACGGRAGPAVRLIEEVGVIASRERVPPGTQAAAEDLLRGVGREADSESSISQAIGLACTANGYVAPYGKLGRGAIDASDVSAEIKAEAREIFDEIQYDSQLAKLVCKLRG
jgi:hypothetical protein